MAPPKENILAQAPVTTRLVTVPNVLTAGRLLITVFVFYFVIRQQLVSALVLFIVAWGFDAVDGLVARRWGQATAFGYLFDKVVDRLLLIGTGWLLLRGGHVPPAALLIFSKDIMLLPLLLWQLILRHPIRDLGKGGKLLTLLQGGALIWLMLAGPAPLLVSLIVGAIGLMIGIQHLYQTLIKKHQR